MMHIEDKKHLQNKLHNFAVSPSSGLEIYPYEAEYLSSLVNKDWRN